MLGRLPISARLAAVAVVAALFAPTPALAGTATQRLASAQATLNARTLDVQKAQTMAGRAQDALATSQAARAAAEELDKWSQQFSQARASQAAAAIRSGQNPEAAKLAESDAALPSGLDAVNAKPDESAADTVEQAKSAEQDAAQALEDAQAQLSQAEAAEKAATEERDAAQADAQAERDAQMQANMARAASEGNPELSAVDWSCGHDAFVDEWGTRIDGYLAGSPLAGRGRTFAEAAWENGVDPRWSPAISNTESSKGACCFRPCNAWGWGGSGWSDWDTAINAHVAGLSSGYGYTISMTAANKYCPPTASHWYSTTLAQMQLI
ncbi:hypothetical protein QJ043_05305 [Olsenella sp. YH-ols2217]|uniref:Uncharacterized protein n=1 Tax=Kribbibacterium absianum TaxID=3044210 RepID=A0ABT6ZKD4_9ACTN|nr:MULTISPECIES: hypothetical protein [unclassified Olsenella]MDJ1122544.1 hypothetical protein [Olsenella sp. YH-ols2216]MDJ1129496.1 hypothetical protein [Olsenella sp. YH-ols2217]